MSLLHSTLVSLCPSEVKMNLKKHQIKISLDKMDVSWPLRTSLYVLGADCPSVHFSFRLSAAVSLCSRLTPTAMRGKKWLQRDEGGGQTVRGQEGQRRRGGGKCKERSEGHRCLNRMLLWEQHLWVTVYSLWKEPREGQKEVDRWNNTQSLGLVKGVLLTIGAQVLLACFFFNNGWSKY